MCILKSKKEGHKMFIKLRVEESDTTVINTDNIISFDTSQVFMINEIDSPFCIVKEDYEHLIRELMPKTKSISNHLPKVEDLELFVKLHTLTGGKGKVVFSLDREKKLKNLLTKHRMTPELLIKAATNIGQNEFLQGKNDRNTRYGDVDYLLRPDKAAKYAEDQIEKKKSMF